MALRMLIIGSMLGVANSFLSHVHVVKSQTLGEAQAMGRSSRAQARPGQGVQDTDLIRLSIGISKEAVVYFGHLRQTVFPAKWFDLTFYFGLHFCHALCKLLFEVQ